MKKVIMFFGAMCLLTISSFAQVVQEVPAEVAKGFQGKFVSIEEVEWEQNDEGNWEAEFAMKDQQYSALFTETGDWVQTKQSLSATNIPANLIATLKSEVMGYEMKDAYMIETPKGTYYKMAVDVDGQKHIIKLDADGNVLEKKMGSEKSGGLK